MPYGKSSIGNVLMMDIPDVQVHPIISKVPFLLILASRLKTGRRWILTSSYSRLQLSTRSKGEQLPSL